MYDLPASQRSGIASTIPIWMEASKSASLRERGLATIVNPGDAIDLTHVLDDQDAAYLGKSL